MSDGSDDQAERLLNKVRTFADGLDAGERELFAVLIGPGVEALVDTHDGDDEVQGFGDGLSWEPGSLRARLSSAVRATEWQIVERR